MRLAGWTALRLTLGYAAVTAVLLGFFGDLIASLYRLDAGIEGLAVQLLLVAAFFQLGDTVQATAAGALRGLGDTQVPFLLTLGSHVLLALPLAAAAGLIVFRDPLWIWYSLAAGLTVLAALLVIRFQFKVRSLEGKP